MTDPNITAFLDLLARSEGTSTCKETKNDGYDVIVGDTIFTDYSDHPRVFVDLPNLHIVSSAAGRYQILAHNFEVYRVHLHLNDKTVYPDGAFSPKAQDAIAMQMMRECHAITMLSDGNIEGAISACASRWASLPGNSYGQHQNKMDDLVDAYESLGGHVA